jgi:hypothetical protein
LSEVGEVEATPHLVNGVQRDRVLRQAMMGEGFLQAYTQLRDVKYG